MLEAGLAMSWTNQRLAKALDCGVSTLKRNFGPLLRIRDGIPDRLQLALFAAAARKAVEKQDMGALRQVRAMIEDNDRRMTDARLRQAQSGGQQKMPADDAPEKEEKLGKKAAALRDARQAVEGGDDADWDGWLLDPTAVRPH
ncbi:hypothetical protein HKCCE4037_06485 [Rhodobacterales bacterium HKCCE4037]|nr:hypothetical protein [Rhodobacterales bacterium HKCCE4037]